MEPRWICITGPDGAGKSSLIRELLEEEKLSNGKKIKEVSIWDQFHLPEERRYIHIKSKQHVDQYLNSLAPASRTFFLLHCLVQSMEMARQEKVELAFLNGYWYKYMASEVAHGGQMDTLIKWAKVFPEPEMIFSIQVPVTVAAVRKTAYSGYESGFPTQRDQITFLRFQTKVHAAFEQIMKGKPVHLLDGQQPLAVLKNQVLNKMGYENT